MIPILYEADEIDFSSNGIGRLRDCIRCEVTEERNGIYEVEFEYPVTGQHFDDIKCGRIIAVEHDEAGDVQPFDIVSYTRPINGVATFHAQHISYRQKGITVIASSGSGGRSLPGIFATLKSGWPSNPFNYYSDISGQRRVAAFDLTPRTVRQLLGGVEGSILDAFGGEYEWDRFNVNLWKTRGTKKDYTIRYGVNLLEFQEELDTSETYDACIPYWMGEDGLVLADPAMITSGESYNGRVNCAPLDLSEEFEEKPTVAQVTAAGQAYMSSNQPYLPSQTITVNFIRLQDSDEYEAYADLQKCSLCDSVNVVFPMYGVTGSFKIVKVVWDVLLERYSLMELGNLHTSLSQALGIGGIQGTAEQANRNVAGAWASAADAQSTAAAASETAAAAQESAASASQAATTAWEHADDAHQAATAAQASAGEAFTAATEAKASAVSATNSANNALVQLGVVEDVAGTLRWISEHGEYVPTTDTTVHSGTVYFVYEHGDYVPVVNPPAGSNPSALGWYVLDVTQSTTDYIMAHMAVTSAGLWVLPVNQLAPHDLVDSQGNQLVDSSNNPIVDFSSDPQNATGYKVLLSGGGGQTGDFPIGLTIYNDEGEAIANYGETATIGKLSGYNINIDFNSFDIRYEDTVLARFGSDVNDYPEVFLPKYPSIPSGMIPHTSEGTVLDILGLEAIGDKPAEIDLAGISQARYRYNGIFFNDYSLPLGATREGNNTYSTTVASGSWDSVLNVDLSEGTWLVVFGAGFEANATGYRRIVLNTSNSGTPSPTRYDMAAPAVNGVSTNLQATRIISIPKNSGRVYHYLHVYQNSGSSIDVYPYINAFKLL